jgi:hypothetical protein
MKEEQRKCELMLSEKSQLAKSEIKDKFNVLAKQIKIDTQALVNALLAPK